MKKYLIKGALALFGGGLLFSCAEKESEYVPLAQQKVQTFEQVFKEVYGDIDPYQDWGFGQGKVEIDPNDSSLVVEVVDMDDNIALTRLGAFARGGARTRQANENGNQWEDMGYSIPADITEEELADVLEVFNEVGSESYSSLVDWSDFFVQQVYKGVASYYARNQYNDEDYSKGLKDNPTSFVGSDKMDWLCTKTNKHVNVISWYPYEEEIVIGDFFDEHINNFNDGNNTASMTSEKSNRSFSGITLMLNSNTNEFGYHDVENGGSAPYYYFRMEVINGNYYVGFDYAAEGSNPNQDVRRDYIYNDWIVKIVPASPSVPEPEPEPEPEPVISYEYPEDIVVTWTQIESGRVFCEDLGVASREDLDYNDVVFDAIVFQKDSTYTKWKETYKDDVYQGREYEVSPTTTTKYYANVEILAAGGTIPITIEDLQVHNQFSPEAGIATMVNTRDNNSTAYGSYEARGSVQLSKGAEKNFTTKDGKTYSLRLFEIANPGDNQFIRSIRIVSSFGASEESPGTQVAELSGAKGGAPQKFMAPIGTDWASERKNISLAYPDFDAWVGGGSAPWSNKNSNYIYSGSVASTSSQLPLVMKARKTIVKDSEVALWTGTKVYDSVWGLEDFPASLDVEQFNSGDRLRFYGENIGNEAWITVEVGSITPYFVDSDFPNIVVNSDGSTTPATSGCIEVVLDNSSASLLNAQISGGTITFRVHGRNFTLTSICRVK